MLKTIKYWFNLIDYLHCKWGECEIDPMHPDVLKIQLTIKRFEEKYGKDWPLVSLFGLFNFRKYKRRRAKQCYATKPAKIKTQSKRRVGSLCFHSWYSKIQMVDYLRRKSSVVPKELS